MSSTLSIYPNEYVCVCVFFPSLERYFKSQLYSIFMYEWSICVRVWKQYRKIHSIGTHTIILTSKKYVVLMTTITNDVFYDQWKALMRIVITWCAYTRSYFRGKNVCIHVYVFMIVVNALGPCGPIYSIRRNRNSNTYFHLFNIMPHKRVHDNYPDRVRSRMCGFARAKGLFLRTNHPIFLLFIVYVCRVILIATYRPLCVGNRG